MKRRGLKFQRLKLVSDETKLKTASFASIHFSVAFTVVYLLTGDAFVGGVMAMLEPALKYSRVLLPCEKVWLRKSDAQDHNFASTSTLKQRIESYPLTSCAPQPIDCGAQLYFWGK